ncbi:hypothetical protein O3M35_008623 [Rhynocoris fuscipes]|uniref:Decapping nuclease n=1 Tax=Rhynocoris fuscipes TaxID=488301 RepID=A0AAW1D7L1_9HEMI
MAPLFWFEITDWKNEKSHIRILEQCTHWYFSSNDWKKCQIKFGSLKSLKYFDNAADLDINRVQTKINQLHEKIRIMNTPFEINQDRRKWIIKAEIFKDNRVHLYYDKDQELNISEEMSKQYELLKRYLFLNSTKGYRRKVTSAFNEIFGTLIRLRFGAIYLFYTTEIPGVISDNEIINIEQLDSVEPVYYDIFEDGEFSEDLINYNPIWWSKAVLTNAKQCIIASYDKHNDCIKNIYKFNMDKFVDKTKYENLWSPDAAWNFLNDFLQFVKDTVNNIPCEFRNECVWKFQSFPNNEPIVSCEIFFYKIENGQKKLTPVDEKTFS